MTRPPDDPELRGYDGYGAPIYDHQEDDMPTDLPPGFKGVGKDEPEEDGLPGIAIALGFCLAIPVTIAFFFALTGSLVWLGLWAFTHLP